jgi:hypothetical protein
MPQATIDDIWIFIYEHEAVRTRDLERQFVTTRMMSRGTMYKYKRQLELEGRIQARPIAAKPPYHIYSIPQHLREDVVAIKETRSQQLQEREQTLHEHYWSILPSYILNILDLNEQLYYVYHYLNRLYNLITNIQILSWTHVPSDMFTIEHTYYWQVKYDEIVNVSQPSSRLGPDGTHHTIKIRASAYTRILDFGHDSMASWEAYRKLEEAYMNYLGNDTESPLKHAQNTSPQPPTSDNNCPRCRRDFSMLPTMIRYCPFCGQRARKQNTRMSRQEAGPFTQIFE